MGYAKDVGFFEQAEKLILNQVKFIDIVLQEIRERDKMLLQVLGSSYGKLIGISTPFKDAVNPLQKIRTEFGAYLKAARESLEDEYKKQFGVIKRKNSNRKEFPPEMNTKA